jgi:mannose-6-phosphate isomerase
MELYPLKFEPILKRVLWGGVRICEFKQLECDETDIGESWELSQVSGFVSKVANGYLKGKDLTNVIEEFGENLLGKSVTKRFGNVFPLLFKFIDAEADLSIQVHPDDALAMKRHGGYGKTEMWYVIESQKNSKLISGFNCQLTPQVYENRMTDGTIEGVLQSYHPEVSDVFFIPAGRVHALGAGLLIAEIQQSSDITYRIYDYNRTDSQGKQRELHTELAKEAIDFSLKNTAKVPYDSSVAGFVELVTNNHFTTNRLSVKEGINSGQESTTFHELERDYSNLDSFVVLMCVEGEGQLYCDDHAFSIKHGDTLLLPATIDGILLSTLTNLVILETYL